MDVGIVGVNDILDTFGEPSEDIEVLGVGETANL